MSVTTESTPFIGTESAPAISEDWLSVWIGLLVFAQKIGEVCQIVIRAAFHPLAETRVVKPWSAAVPELQDR